MHQTIKYHHIAHCLRFHLHGQWSSNHQSLRPQLTVLVLTNGENWCKQEAKDHTGGIIELVCPKIVSFLFLDQHECDGFLYFRPQRECLIGWFVTHLLDVHQRGYHKFYLQLCADGNQDDRNRKSLCFHQNIAVTRISGVLQDMEDEGGKFRSGGHLKGRYSVQALWSQISRWAGSGCQGYRHGDKKWRESGHCGQDRCWQVDSDQLSPQDPLTSNRRYPYWWEESHWLQSERSTLLHDHDRPRTNPHQWNHPWEPGFPEQVQRWDDHVSPQVMSLGWDGIGKRRYRWKGH